MQYFVYLLVLLDAAHAFAPAGLRVLSPPALASAPALAVGRTRPPLALDVADPSYNLAIGSVILGGVFGLPSRQPSIVSRLGYTLGALCAAFGLFIAFQTTTLRFTFSDSDFALVKADGSSTGKNVVVGGENVWRYDTFVNWDFLPSESFPVLVYFRETQTPAESREEVPLVVDNLDGQVHFFPAISDAQQLKAQFLQHRCAKI